MTKMKKKKITNKIRRRIMRTASALTMTMAVAVAAIPVENLGTVSAESEEPTAVSADASAFGEKEYTAYVAANMYESTEEKSTEKSTEDGDLETQSDAGVMTDRTNGGFEGYSVDDETKIKTGQTIADNWIYDAFQVVSYSGKGDSSKTGTGIIYKYNGTQSTVNIEHEIAYNYAIIDPSLVADAAKELDGDVITFGFKQDSTTLNNPSGSTETFYSFNLNSDGNNAPSFSYTANLTTTKAVDDNYKIGPITYISSDYPTFFGKYDDGYADGYFSNLQVFDEYKSKVNSYNTDFTTAMNNYNASSKTESDWEVLTKAISAAEDTYGFDFSDSNSTSIKITLSTADYPYKDNLRSFYNDAFCKRGIYNGIPLEGFQLSFIKHTSEDDDLYLLIWVKTGSGVTVKDEIESKYPGAAGTGYADKVDSDGYICEGRIRIAGIYNNAFEDKNLVTKVTIKTEGSDFKYIGNNAFLNCTGLEQIIIPSSCEVIGNRAFYNCSSISKIDVENSSSDTVTDFSGTVLKTLGAEAFVGTQITGMVMPSTLKTVGAGCFKNSLKITSVDFTKVTTNPLVIEPCAFYNCYNLGDVGDSDSDKVKFSGGNGSIEVVIGTGAFALGTSGSQTMKNFKFPYNTKVSTNEYKIPTDGSRDDYILYGRTSLENVTIQKSWGGDIPENTFGQCYGLCKVTLQAIAFQDIDDIKISFASDQMFKDVTNSSFFVEGPGFTRSSTRTPTDYRKQVVLMKRADSVADPNDPDKDLTNYVPYKYLESDNTERLEITAGKDGEYLADIKPIGDNKANIDKYIENKYYTDLKDTGFTNIKQPTANSSEITVPAYIGNYRIYGLEKDCFGSIRNQIETLNISDGSLVSISDSALANAKNLSKVTIGNSVTNIGANAFAGCVNLQDVYFNDPYTSDKEKGDPLTDFVIADGAFSTNSPYLTFHGIIAEDYGPFNYAMDSTQTHMYENNNKRNICYKTDYPLDKATNLTVLLDNKAGGVSTLVDYPHLYEAQRQNSSKLSSDSDYILLERIAESVKANSNTALTATEEKVLNSTLIIDIPDGVKSFDTKSFFDGNDNVQNIAYIDNYEVASNGYKQVNILDYDRLDLSQNESTYGSSTINNVEYLYSKETTSTTDRLEGIAGLFSGLFVERGLGLIGDYDETLGDNSKTPKTSENDNSQEDEENGIEVENLYSGTGTAVDYVEDNIWGNDHLTQVAIGNGVTKFPSEKAFYSCENLVKVVLGQNVSDVGTLPFKGCKKLTDIVTDGNTKYEAENGILYESNGDGTYTIVEVLESRGSYGSLKGQTEITSTKYDSNGVSSDPLLQSVTAIDDEAFSDCLKITTVDLRDTSITRLPNYCFENSENVRDIYLPDTCKSLAATGSLATGNNRGWADPVTIHTSNPDLIIEDGVLGDYDEDTDEGTCYILKGPEKDANGGVSDIKRIGDAKDTDNVKFVSDTDYTITFVNNYVTPNVVLGTKPSSQNDVPSAINKLATDGAPDGFKFTGHWIQLDSNGNEIARDEAAYDGATEDRIVYAEYEVDTSNVIYTKDDVYVEIVGGGYIVSSLDSKTGEYKSYNGTSQTTLTIPSGSILTLGYSNSTDVIWSSTKYAGQISDFYANPTSFTVPDYADGDTVITVNVRDLTPSTPNDSDNSGDDNSGNDNSGDNSTGGGTTGDNTTGGTTSGSTSSGTTTGTTTTTKYTVTVNYGSGSGSYAAGDIVNISAYAPTSSSRVFSKWTSNNSSVGFADSTGATTTFVMPASDVTVTANYKTRSDDDDDDDTTTSSRPGSSTTTTTVSSTPSNSSSSSTTSTVSNNGTGTSTNTGNGNRIYITKNGVSNTDLASVNVTGSTDNFVVKISETDEANQMAKQALTNTYGSLEGIQYFPMDISLYDSTGQNKITDTYGLNVTVTMPIPDVLIQYGGNARVASTDNGVLTQITPKFTTIDGIACMSFVPPHFSPYVIYVDTNNLIAGQMYDSTPKTGDPIHPKWFAAIGMACVSVLLFVTSDGRKRKKYRTA